MSQPQLAAAATAANSHVQFSDLSWSQISGFSYFFMCSYSSRHSGAAAPCETKPARLSRVFCVGEADAFGSSFCRRSGRFRELIAEYRGGLHFVSHGELIVFFPSRQAVLKMEGKQSSVFSRFFKHGLPSIADNERSKLKFVPNNERFSFKSCTFFLAF